MVLSARPCIVIVLPLLILLPKEMVHASSLTDDFETVIMNLQTKRLIEDFFMRSLFGELREHILGKGVKIVFLRVTTTVWFVQQPV